MSAGMVKRAGVRWDEIVHFRREEWGQDPDRVAPRLVSLLDAVRQTAGVPVIIHTAWSASGHAAQSYHYKGEAVDFRFGGALSPVDAFTILAAFPFGGVGFYPEWSPQPGWHVDLRPGPRRLFWVGTAGRYRYGPQALAQALAASCAFCGGKEAA